MFKGDPGKSMLSSVESDIGNEYRRFLVCVCSRSSFRDPPLLNYGNVLIRYTCVVYIDCCKIPF